MTTHLAPPPVLKQRKSLTGLIEENRRRARAEAAAASPQRMVSDLFVRFESPGAGSSRHPNVSPSRKRTVSGVDPEQRQNKAANRLQDKIAEFEVRARSTILEKNNLHSELALLQNECRRSAEREAALRVALERAEACIQGGTDGGPNPVVLQRKLEDLERRHADGIQKHIMELDVVRRKLEQAQKTIEEQEGLILLQHQQAAEKDTRIMSLEATVVKQEEELESLKVQLREAEIRQLAGRNAVDTLSHERRRHEATKAKLKALQASNNPEPTHKKEDLKAARSKLSAMEGNFSKLEAKYNELRSAARTLADEYELQLSELDATRRMLNNLTAAYGRLASQGSVGREVFDDVKFEKQRLELALHSLETELAGREARVYDLEEMVEESRGARRMLEASLADSEEEINMLRKRIGQDQISQAAEGWNLYYLLNDYFETFLQWETNEISLERARAEGEIQSLRAINNTLEQTLRTGSDIQKKLTNIEVRFTTLQVQSKAKAVAHLATLEELALKKADLADARSSVLAVRAKLEQIEGTVRADVRPEASLTEEGERSRGKAKTIAQSEAAKEGPETEDDSSHVGEPEQSHESLTREVAVLLSQKSLAEDEAKRLGELNAALLGRSNSSQSMVYIGAGRKELDKTEPST